MKRFLFWTTLIVVFSVVTAACGASNQTPQPKINIPQDLPSDWVKTNQGFTNWYVKDLEGVVNADTGWTQFNQADGTSIRAIWLSTPNPSPYNGDFGFNFDVQRVDGNSFVLEHAFCFDVGQYNDAIDKGEKNATKRYKNTNEMEFSLIRTISVTQRIGCKFGDGQDILYAVHTHGVLSDSGTVIPEPTNTATPTSVPTTTPGPGTPTAAIPTATLANLGTVPFGCGQYLKLEGAIDWSKVSFFGIDCKKSIYTFIFRGDDVSQLSIDYWYDQEHSVLAARSRIGECKVEGLHITCERFGFDVTAVALTTPVGTAQLSMPQGCGNVSIEGVIDWSKIGSVNAECANSRFRLSFRGDNMDRVYFYVEPNQAGTRINGFTQLIGCSMNGGKANENNGVSVWDSRKITVSCPDYGLDFIAVPR